VNTESKGEKGNFRNPKNTLVRYQLLEILVRIAKRKFLDSKVVNSWKEAMTVMINKHLNPLLTKMDPMAWRKDRYYNEECDVVLKFYNRLIVKLYDNYSGAS